MRRRLTLGTLLVGHLMNRRLFFRHRSASRAGRTLSRESLLFFSRLDSESGAKVTTAARRDNDATCTPAQSRHYPRSLCRARGV